MIRVSCSDLSHSSVHVTIREDNERRFATQLQRTLLDIDSTTSKDEVKRSACQKITNKQASLKKSRLFPSVLVTEA